MSQDATGAPSYLQLLFSLDGVEGGSLERASAKGANLEKGRCPGKTHFSLWKRPSNAGGKQPAL